MFMYKNQLPSYLVRTRICLLQDQHVWAHFVNEHVVVHVPHAHTMFAYIFHGGIDHWGAV